MNDLRGKKLDHFFREELAHHEHPFNENHWHELERRLKRRNRSRAIGWIVASGLAAMLLIALATGLLLTQRVEEGGQVAKSSVQRERETSTREPKGAPGDQLAVGQKNDSRSPQTDFPSIQRKKRSLGPASAPELAFVALLKAEPKVEGRIPTKILLPPPSPASLDNLAPATEEVAKNEIPTKQTFKPSLSLSVFAGPDVNGVNNLRNTGWGGSGGVALTYTILPRLSISAGVAYAKKLYSTEFANYKPNTSYTFPTNPSMVDADCRVLDLPVNVNYTVWNKKSNTIQLTAGMSSYLMLKEDYYFDYKYNSQSGPDHYEARNKNKHYLGVINLAAGYEKALNKDLSLGVSPYVKLPVTGIGYGNVRLESAGITTNLKFNLGGLKSNKK